MNYKFTEFIYGSEDYQQCLLLREQVLRKPLGRVLTPAELEKDIGDVHLGLKSPQVIACLILTRISDQIAKVRQVAVAPQMQNRGLGKFLVLAAENFAREKGFQSLELHARISAQDFYLKLGYRAEGESFEAVGIPHIQMVKKL